MSLNLLTFSPPTSPPLITTSKPTHPPPPPPPPPPPFPSSKFFPPLPPQQLLIQKIYSPYHIYRHIAALLLQQCESTAQVHRIMPLIFKNGFYNLPFFQTKLLALFCRFNSLGDAARVFEPIEDKLYVLYNTMLQGYCKGDRLDAAFELFCRMKRDGVPPWTYNYSYLVKACGDGYEMKRGKEIHGDLVVNGFASNLIVMTSAVSMYAKCGRIEDAYKAFYRIPVKDLVAWNAIIAGYAQNGYPNVALELMISMQEEERCRPDWITVVSVLPACADMPFLFLGKSVHAYAMRAGFDSFVNVSTALMDMYSKRGAVATARSIFDGMDERTVITWNSMIDGYVQSGDPKEALALFRRTLGEGVEPTNVTIIEALNASADSCDLESGKFIHELSARMGLGSDVRVINSLISMYSKCKNVDVAVQLFSKLQNKNLASWNAMISGFSHNGHVKEALTYLREMSVSRIKIDYFTLGGIIPALSEFPSPRRAKWIHGLAVRTCSDQNLFVMTALIDMYSKCGDLWAARWLFDTMDMRHVMTWNAMIDAYGTHGLGSSAMELFKEMQKDSSIEPDESTFLCILSACSPSGLVKEGRLYFLMMREEYRLEPKNEHYGAMVDLLGRAGLLDEAWDFIGSMPINPGIGVLGSMLSACTLHQNVELGEKAADMLVDLDPDDGGYHMLLANVCAASSVWNKVAELRSKVDNKEFRRFLESSFMELDNKFHTFDSGSADRPQSKIIFAYLLTLLEKIKAAGYVPRKGSICHGGDQYSIQEQILRSHSEMVAIAFGLLNAYPGVPILVRKNLCICQDCHEAIKYISLVVDREIVVRDMQRFHRFMNGDCYSC